jgi:hypothetical protein
VPLTVTWLALDAVTIKVDEVPAPMEVGFAEMPTVGAGSTDTVAIAEVLPPIPVAVAV